MYVKSKLSNLTSSVLSSLVLLNTERNSLSDILDWIRIQNESILVKVDQIHFKDLSLWKFNEASLVHESGKFFSIDGIQVKTDYGKIHEWEQPIINQPEVGYLGFITKEFNGVLHFLLQAKIEPGNINYVQLSPTLQATKSNYSQVHKGKKPAYLDYFQNVKSDCILLDQLQSEQGARFLKKRNRNIIIKVEGEIPILNNYTWVTLGQIKALMRHDNVINMDTRTVISGIPLDDIFNNSKDSVHYASMTPLGNKWVKSYIGSDNALLTLSEIISLVTHYKTSFELEVKKVNLLEISEWKVRPDEICHAEKKFFKVIAANIQIDNREVVKWSQPLIQPLQEGLCAFIVKEINGILHFIVQAKLECGNFDVIEFAPTVQCLTGNYDNENSKSRLPFLDYALNARPKQILFDSYQSEEGGRFFKEQNRNILILADPDFEQNLPERYVWMTLNQLQRFIQFNNYINIQARSLLASLTFV